MSHVISNPRYRGGTIFFQIFSILRVFSWHEDARVFVWPACDPPAAYGVLHAFSVLRFTRSALTYACGPVWPHRLYRENALNRKPVRFKLKKSGIVKILPYLYRTLDHFPIIVCSTTFSKLILFFIFLSPISWCVMLQTCMSHYMHIYA